MKPVLVIALAGAAGALSRHYLGAFAQRLSGSDFPWGVLLVNSLGCFLFGLFVGLIEHRFPVGESTRLLILAGFLGSFTTFSTYAFNTSQLLVERQWALAVSNILLHNILGILLLLVGLFLPRLIYGAP